MVMNDGTVLTLIAALLPKLVLEAEMIQRDLGTIHQARCASEEWLSSSVEMSSSFTFSIFHPYLLTFQCETAARGGATYSVNLTKSEEQLTGAFKS